MSDKMTVCESVGDGQRADVSTSWVAEEFLRLGDEYYSAGRYEDAARKYQLAFRFDSANTRAATSYNRAIRHCVPRWHFEMLHDEDRAIRYDKAITPEEVKAVLAAWPSESSPRPATGSSIAPAVCWLACSAARRGGPAPASSTSPAR